MKYTSHLEQDSDCLDKPHKLSSDLEVGIRFTCRSQVTSVTSSRIKGSQDGSSRVKDHDAGTTSNSTCKASMNSENQCTVNDLCANKCNSPGKKQETLTSEEILERFKSLERSTPEKKGSKTSPSENEILRGSKSVQDNLKATSETKEENQRAKKDMDGSTRFRPRSIVSLVWQKSRDMCKVTSVTENASMQTEMCKVTSIAENASRQMETQSFDPTSEIDESLKMSPDTLVSLCTSPGIEKSACMSPEREIMPMDLCQEIDQATSPQARLKWKMSPRQTPENEKPPSPQYEREISPLRTPEREGLLMFSPERDASPVRSLEWHRDDKQSSERSPERDISSRRTSRRDPSSDQSPTRDRSPAGGRRRGKGRSCSWSPQRRSKRSYSRSSSRERRRKYSRKRSQSFRRGQASRSSNSNIESSESDSTSRDRYLNRRSEQDLTSRERFLKNKARYQLNYYSQTSRDSRKCSTHKSRRQVRSDSGREQGGSRNGYSRNGSTSDLQTTFKSCVRRANQLLQWSDDAGKNGLTHLSKSAQAKTFPESVSWNDILSRAKKYFKNNSASDDTFFHPPPAINSASLYSVHKPAVDPQLPPPNSEFLDLCTIKQTPSCLLSAERLQTLEVTARRAMNPLTYLERFLSALRKLIPHTDQRMNRQDFNDMHELMDAISRVWADLAELTVFNSAAFFQLRREAYLNQTELSSHDKETLLRQTPLTSTSLFNSATRHVVNKKR